MPEQNPTRSGGVLRPVLWSVLVISMAANAATSIGGLPMPISTGFGLITLACAVTLGVHHRRHRAG